MPIERVPYWIELADYDIGTAETLYDVGDGSMLLSCATKPLRKHSRHTGAIRNITTLPISII